MNNLEFIHTIRQLIADGKTDEALTLMRTEVAKFDPSLVTDATLLESRYTNAKADFTLKGILPREDFDRTVAQVNYALLEIVEKLEKTAPLSIGTPKNKNSGRILHNIPGTMPIGKERRCIVRIAYDDEALLRDLTVDENTTIQSVRIAEVMGVELVDFNETPTFSVRTITEEEQFISSDDYTQWLFMVKALREGTFPLTLKVSVIEEVNGKERKRDIVLEKEVFVISQLEQPPVAAATTQDAQPQPTETHFEDSTIRFNYVTSDNDKAAAASTSSKRFSASGIASTLAVIAMAMVGWVTFQTFSPPRDVVINDNTGKNGQQGNGKGNGGTNSGTIIDTLKSTPPSVLKDNSSQLVQNGNKNEPVKGTGTGGNPTPTNEPSYKMQATPDSKNGTIANVGEKGGSKIKPKTNVIIKKNSDSPAAYEMPKNAKPPKLKVKPPTTPPQTTVESKIHIGEVNIGPSPSTPPTQTASVAEVKTFRVNLILKGEMKKAQISVDGQSVDKFLKKNIWGTPQYIEFKSSKERHTITFKRGNVSCSITDVLIENGSMTVEPCSFE
jgi:hypothetical protein